jgi:hypothetical protein
MEADAARMRRWSGQRDGAPPPQQAAPRLAKKNKKTNLADLAEAYKKSKNVVSRI